MARPTKLETENRALIGENRSLKGTNQTLLQEIDELRRWETKRVNQVDALIARLDMARIVIVDQAAELTDLRRKLSMQTQSLRVID